MEMQIKVHKELQKPTWKNHLLEINRMQHKIKVLKSIEDDDENKQELLTANPCEEIPRNKLTEKLAHGLQAFIQRM